MWDILKSNDDLNKYIGTEVFVRFEVDPKIMTCCTSKIKDFLQGCADKQNKLKDGFYMLLQDDPSDPYHGYGLVVNGEVWSARHNFIKEIYGIKEI